MGLWSKLTGGQPAISTTSRTAKDRLRDSGNVRKIDAGTALWERRGGRGPRKDR